MSNSLQSHGLQHARFPCPSPSPRACSNSCSVNQWCHPTISFSCPLLLLPSIFPTIRVFSNESALYIRWPTCWSSTSASVLPIIFRADLGLSSLISFLSKELSSVFSRTTIQKIILQCSVFFMVQLSIHDYWKNHSFDYTNLCQQNLSLLFNTLSRFDIAFLSRSKRLLISWL